MVRNPFIARTAKDGKVTHQYFEDDVDDSVLQTIVRQSYKFFKVSASKPHIGNAFTTLQLFNGPIGQIPGGPDVMRSRLQTFITPFLNTINFEQLDLFATLEGIQFLPVDKNVYLRIQSFINLTEDHFPKVQYAAFLYRDHLLWSGLEQDDMIAVYAYLTSPMASVEVCIKYCAKKY